MNILVITDGFRYFMKMPRVRFDLRGRSVKEYETVVDYVQDELGYEVERLGTFSDWLVMMDDKAELRSEGDIIFSVADWSGRTFPSFEVMNYRWEEIKEENLRERSWMDYIEVGDHTPIQIEQPEERMITEEQDQVSLRFKKISSSNVIRITVNKVQYLIQVVDTGVRIGKIVNGRVQRWQYATSFDRHPNNEVRDSSENAEGPVPGIDHVATGIMRSSLPVDVEVEEDPEEVQEEILTRRRLINALHEACGDNEDVSITDEVLRRAGEEDFPNMPENTPIYVYRADDPSRPPFRDEDGPDGPDGTEYTRIWSGEDLSMEDEEDDDDPQGP